MCVEERGRGIVRFGTISTDKTPKLLQSDSFNSEIQSLRENSILYIYIIKNLSSTTANFYDFFLPLKFSKYLPY